MDLDSLYQPSPDAPALRVERRFAKQSPDKIWNLLLDPAHAAKVWFGSTLETDLRPGGFLKWTGSWEGKAFEESAMVLECRPGVLLDSLFFSAFSGQTESPTTRLRLVLRLEPEGEGARLVVVQENFKDTAARDHSVASWNGILDIVEKIGEGD